MTNEELYRQFLNSPIRQKGKNGHEYPTVEAFYEREIPMGFEDFGLDLKERVWEILAEDEDGIWDLLQIEADLFGMAKSLKVIRLAHAEYIAKAEEAEEAA